jgi:hypothetical protein
VDVCGDFPLPALPVVYKSKSAEEGGLVGELCVMVLDSALYYQL